MTCGEEHQLQIFIVSIAAPQQRLHSIVPHVTARQQQRQLAPFTVLAIRMQTVRPCVTPI